MASCTIITKCRLCSSEKIEDLFSFGKVALPNAYIKEEDLNKEEEKFPLSLCRCDSCGHIQLKETVNREDLFSNYLYASSTSGSLSKYFGQYTDEIIKSLSLSPIDGYVLDLGSNDGVTLQHFKNRGYQVLGVEPASNLAKIANGKGINTINKFFDEIVAQEILDEHGFPSCILSSNTYAHLECHQSFTNGVKLLLNLDNSFVFENASLLATMKGLFFDQIYADHLGYFWSPPLIKYFRNNGLKLYHIEKTPIQGGSIRCFVKKDAQENDSVLNTLVEELDFGLNKKETYDKFFRKITYLKIQSETILDQILDKGKTISCYGCPAKFALFSKFFGLNSQNVQYVVDDSVFKQNLYAPESKIKIVSRQHFLDNPTDVCIISAWNFADLIKKNNPQYKGAWINIFDL